MGKTIGAVTVLWATLFLWARPVEGEPNEARAHYDRATSAFALGRFAEAADEYEKAFDLAPDSALLYNAAQSHRMAGNQKRALLLYQNYLRVFGDQVANARDVARLIASLRRSIENGEQTPPPQPEPQVDLPAPSPAPIVVEKAPAERPQILPRATAAPTPKPLWRRPWLWGVVGGAAAVLAVGLAVGFTVGNVTDSPRATLGHVEAN